jgi:hypothetical protein
LSTNHETFPLISFPIPLLSSPSKAHISSSAPSSHTPSTYVLHVTDRQIFTKIQRPRVFHISLLLTLNSTQVPKSSRALQAAETKSAE